MSHPFEFSRSRILALAALAASSVAPACSVAPPVARPSLPPGPIRTALLYVPNRVLDLTDIARAGVEVGPGVGVDAMVTDNLRLAAMKRWSKGIGYQTLRNSPFKDSEESRLQAGPAVEASVVGTPWLVDPWDVRLEAHVLIVGAHLAVNLAEMFDLFAGLLTFDPRADDMT